MSCFCDGSTGHSFWENTASYWMTEIRRGMKTEQDLLRRLLQMQSPNVPPSHMRKCDLYLTPFSHRPQVTAVKQIPACTTVNFISDMINKFREVNLILMQRLWRDSSNILLHASPPPMKFSLKSHGVGSTQTSFSEITSELTQCAWLIFSTHGTGKNEMHKNFPYPCKHYITVSDPSRAGNCKYNTQDKQYLSWWWLRVFICECVFMWRLTWVSQRECQVAFFPHIEKW